LMFSSSKDSSSRTTNPDGSAEHIPASERFDWQPKELLAGQVVDAVARNKKHVRLPRRAALFSLITEVPRRTTEVLLTRVPHQD